MKHTPGPWNVEWRTNGGCYVVPKDGHGTVAKVLVRYSKTDNLAEVQANALLITAAPELLEACKEWLDIWIYLRETYPDIETPDTFNGSTDACGRLRAAIAKAEGVTP